MKGDPRATAMIEIPGEPVDLREEKVSMHWYKHKQQTFFILFYFYINLAT